jgi:hypothetical protein
MRRQNLPGRAISNSAEREIIGAHAVIIALGDPGDDVSHAGRESFERLRTNRRRRWRCAHRDCGEIRPSDRPRKALEGVDCNDGDQEDFDLRGEIASQETKLVGAPRPKLTSTPSNVPITMTVVDAKMAAVRSATTPP